jgi:hypothetical protein
MTILHMLLILSWQFLYLCLFILFWQIVKLFFQICDELFFCVYIIVHDVLIIWKLCNQNSHKWSFVNCVSFDIIHVPLHNFYLVLYFHLLKQFEFCIVLIILQFHCDVKASIKENVHDLLDDFQFDNFTLEPFHVCFFILSSTFNCHIQKFSACVLPSDTNTYLNSKG